MFMRFLQQLSTNLANLLKVKTIVTLAVVFTFCLLTIRGLELSSEFVMIATSVITYYFCKNDRKEDESW